MYNTGLSGLAAEVLTCQDWIRLELLNMMLTRKLLGVRSIRLARSGTKKQKSDRDIRELVHIPTMFSELRKRRLKWWQAVTRHPADNVGVRAALFGTNRREKERGLSRLVSP